RPEPEEILVRASPADAPRRMRSGCSRAATAVTSLEVSSRDGPSSICTTTARSAPIPSASRSNIRALRSPTDMTTTSSALPLSRNLSASSTGALSINQGGDRASATCEGQPISLATTRTLMMLPFACISQITPVLPPYLEQSVRDLADRAAPDCVHESAEYVFVLDHRLLQADHCGSRLRRMTCLESAQAIDLRLLLSVSGPHEPTRG